MSENCSGSCSSCSSDCESRKGPQILRNANNGKVKKVIAVVSGKGGVGKSLVTSMLAVKAIRMERNRQYLMQILQDHLFLSLLDLQKG